MVLVCRARDEKRKKPRDRLKSTASVADHSERAMRGATMYEPRHADHQAAPRTHLPQKGDC
jgi:hypothetical protein